MNPTKSITFDFVEENAIIIGVYRPSFVERAIYRDLVADVANRLRTKLKVSVEIRTYD